MQPFSKVSAAQTNCGVEYGHFRRRWLHGSLKQTSIRTPAITLAIVDGNVTLWKQNEAGIIGEVLLEVESEPVELQNDYLNSPSISVSLPSPSTPIPDRPGLSATFVATTTNLLLPLGPFISPLFSPLMTPRTPRTPTSCLETHSTGYRYKGVQPAAQLSRRLRPGLLELDFSSYPISPRFPSSATIPSPFRMQLQEDVATTPLPSGTPLTARWPCSGFQRSAAV